MFTFFFRSCGPTVLSVRGQFTRPSSKEKKMVVALDGVQAMEVTADVKITPRNDGKLFALNCNSNVNVTGTWMAFDG